jgi:hypothetical protein
MIGFIDTFLIISFSYNQLQQLTVSGCLGLAPFLTGPRVSSLRSDWVGSGSGAGHFFSFRCPLVSTPQLNTELLKCLWILLRLTNEPSNHNMSPFCNSGQTEQRSPTRIFRLLFGVYPLLRNVCQFLQDYSLPRIHALASRCLAMDYSDFQASCHNM